MFEHDCVGANLDIFLKLFYEIWNESDNLPKTPNLDTSKLGPEKIIY
jgi:hypothetical protein